MTDEFTVTLTTQELRELVTLCWETRNEWQDDADDAKNTVVKIINQEQADWWDAVANKLDDARGQGRPCMECGWPGVVEGSIKGFTIEKDAPFTRHGWLCVEHEDMAE